MRSLINLPLLWSNLDPILIKKIYSSYNLFTDPLPGHSVRPSRRFKMNRRKELKKRARRRQRRR